MMSLIIFTSNQNENNSTTIKQKIICNYNNDRRNRCKIIHEFPAGTNPVGWEFTSTMGDISKTFMC